MKNKSIIPREFKRVVKTTVVHLDGTTSEFILTYPNICNNGDCAGLAAMHIEEFVRSMTRYYLLIVSFKSTAGVQYENGKIEWSGCSWGENIIPEGKIYKSGRVQTGKWFKPEALKIEELPKHLKKIIKENNAKRSKGTFTNLDAGQEHTILLNADGL